MFPESTELLLIGCLMESNWTPRSKSNTLTPQINSQTYWQRDISHVMNGIIFCVCSTSAISVPPSVLKWCRKESKKMQVKKESQQNRSRWWIWSRDAAQGIRTCLPSTASESLWKNQIWKVRIFQSSWNEQQPRTVRHVMGASSSDYSEWNIDEMWSSQEWRSSEMLEARTGKTRGRTTSRFVLPAHRQVCHRRRWFGLFHRHRIRPFAQIKITLALGEWSSAKDVWPLFKRCNTRQ